MNATIKKFFVCCLALMLLLVSCTQTQPTPQVIERTVVITSTPAPAPAKLTSVNIPLGWLNNDEFVALQVAQSKGFYQENGLDVNLISGGGSTGFDPLIAINGFDDAIRIGVPAAMSLVIKAYAQGIDVVALAALTQFEPAGFIGLTKNGLKVTGPCDFKGKTIAMQTEAIWYVDALGKLCAEGPLVSGKDFTVIPAGYTPDCLFSGQCDFYCGWKTNQLFILDQQGLKVGTDYGFFLASDFLPFYFGDVIVTTKAYANAHPEIVKAFVQASMRGLQYTLDNPDEAVSITSAVLGVSLEHAVWRIPLQNTLVTNDETAKHGIGYMDLAKVQAMIDFLFANGQIPKTFPAEEVIDNSFLLGP